MNETETIQTPAHESKAIPRDPGFVRINVDGAVCTYLGKDFEIALLLTTPTIAEIIAPDAAGEDATFISFNSGTVEVGRLRLTPGAVVMLVENCLKAVIASQPVDPTALRTAINNVIDTALTDKSK